MSSPISRYILQSSACPFELEEIKDWLKEPLPVSNSKEIAEKMDDPRSSLCNREWDNLWEAEGLKVSSSSWPSCAKVLDLDKYVPQGEPCPSYLVERKREVKKLNSWPMELPSIPNQKEIESKVGYPKSSFFNKKRCSNSETEELKAQSSAQLPSAKSLDLRRWRAFNSDPHNWMPQHLKSRHSF